jgi:hypothetical protein
MNTQEPRRLELVPGQNQKAEPLFKTKEAYEKFWADFYAQVMPILDKQREAHRRSEEAAMHHLVD